MSRVEKLTRGVLVELEFGGHMIFAVTGRKGAITFSVRYGLGGWYSPSFAVHVKTRSEDGISCRWLRGKDAKCVVNESSVTEGEKLMRAFMETGSDRVYEELEAAYRRRFP